MATGPKPALTPLELLERPPIVEESVLSRFYGPAVGALLGFSSIVYANWATSRPVLSGLPRYAIAIPLGLGLGAWADQYRRDYYAEREAIFKHYVRLHPADFPPFPRQKYSDVFEPWKPVR